MLNGIDLLAMRTRSAHSLCRGRTNLERSGFLHPACGGMFKAEYA
jgi:hypothetical protein